MECSKFFSTRHIKFMENKYPFGRKDATGKPLMDQEIWLQNQMQQQQRNLTAHRRAIQHVLNAVTPEETAAAASTFDSVENIPDDDHSVGTRDGDNELWSDAVDRED
ncbi:hypothetical protein HDU78_010104 [Chytriomyces hyalinus]|nr:hypothetical protein HDU78_010104 [Chytriomyces hyalinus]